LNYPQNTKQYLLIAKYLNLKRILSFPKGKIACRLWIYQNQEEASQGYFIVTIEKPWRPLRLKNIGLKEAKKNLIRRGQSDCLFCCVNLRYLRENFETRKNDRSCL
jgi:hypothetical protein